MNVRWLGAALIMAGCGGFGFTMAAGIRKQERLLAQLIRVLGLMEAELQYRLTPLPELCSMAADECSGLLRDVFQKLAIALCRQEGADVASCMDSIIYTNEGFPTRLRRHLHHLGRSMGRFDLHGQLQGLKTVQTACEGDLSRLRQNGEVRKQSYQTLALCAGTAMVILFA